MKQQKLVLRKETKTMFTLRQTKLNIEPKTYVDHMFSLSCNEAWNGNLYIDTKERTPGMERMQFRERM